jgi:ABC-2 type transport system ATP-binding protein
MTDPFVIDIVDLRKRYEDGTEALRGLSLRVPAGSIFAFLGRNGAGKTTTIKILLGMSRLTSGDARVFGLPASSPEANVAIRQRTGFVSEEKDLIDYLTVDGIIRFTASFYPHWRRDLEQRYRDRFELRPQQAISVLSRGGRTKLALLLALCRGVELLVLDEPTSGLDPAMTEEVLEALVAHVADQGTTVFFSSHQIADVEQIADCVAIVDRGRSMLDGSLDDLRSQYRRIQCVFDGDAPQPAFRTPGIVRVQREGRVLTIIASGGADAIRDEARDLGPVSIDTAPIPLKDIFLETVAAEE